MPKRKRGGFGAAFASAFLKKIRAAADEDEYEEEEDEEAGRDPGAPSSSLESFVAPRQISYRRAHHPAEEAKRVQEMTEDYEDRDEGGEKCDLYDLPDKSANKVPDTIDSFYDYLNTAVSVLPESESRRMIAAKYNREILAADQDLNGVMGLRTMTRGIVRRYLRKTLHLPGQRKRMITQLVEWALLDVEYNRSLLYKEKCVNGEPTGQLKVMREGQRMFSHSVKVLKELVLLGLKFELMDKDKDAKKPKDRGDYKTFETTLRFDSY